LFQTITKGDLKWLRQLLEVAHVNMTIRIRSMEKAKGFAM